MVNILTLEFLAFQFYSIHLLSSCCIEHAQIPIFSENAEFLFANLYVISDEVSLGFHDAVTGLSVSLANMSKHLQ